MKPLDHIRDRIPFQISIPNWTSKMDIFLHLFILLVKYFKTNIGIFNIFLRHILLIEF